MDILELPRNNNSTTVRAGAGMAFADNRFYVTTKNSKTISVFDCRMKLCEEICAEREYNSICFDSEECCFWASSAKCLGRIFKLDMCFAEIDCLAFNSCGVITGVSYYCEDDTFAIVSYGRVYKLCKCGELLPVDICKNDACGVAAAAPWLIVTSLQGCQQVVRAMRYDIVVAEFCIPRGEYIEAIVFADACNCAEFYCLVTNRGGFSRICRCNLPIDLDVFECNFNIGKGCVEKHCRKHKAYCKADVIESVALVEAALAHILNAEGEKIQKIVATSCDPEVLLAVNKSVRETIIAATHLEHVLYDKLGLVEDCD